MRSVIGVFIFESKTRNFSLSRYRGEMAFHAHDAIRSEKETIRSHHLLGMLRKSHRDRLNIEAAVYAVLRIEVWKGDDGRRKVRCVVTDEQLPTRDELFPLDAAFVTRLRAEELIGETVEHQIAGRRGESRGYCNPDDL